jgi:hypothetical protein
METSGGNDIPSTLPPDRETATLVFFEDFELGAFFEDFELGALDGISLGSLEGISEGSSLGALDGISEGSSLHRSSLASKKMTKNKYR